MTMLLIFSLNAEAQDAVNVKKNQPAPFDGVLLTPDKAKSVENELKDKDAISKENESLNKSVGLYKANEQIYMDQNKLLLDRDENLTKVLNDTRSTSNWERVGYVSLGVIFTIGAVWGASKLVKRP